MLDTMMQISLTLVAFDKMSRVIRDAVRTSEAEFEKLQNKIKTSSENLNKLGQDFAKFGAGLTAIGGGVAYKLGIAQAIPEALELEHQLRELGNVGQLSAEQLAQMDKRLGSISRYTNQFRSEIAEGLNVLVASGIDPTAALDYMNVIGRTATAAGANIADISKTAFAVTDNLKVNVADLGKTMDILAQAGKEGRFELKDMSQAFPSLTAGASMLGMRGVPAVTQLGAALQVAMKGAGSAAEAATNFESFLQAITSPMAVKRFDELYHVNLPKFLQQAIADSKDPIEEIVKLINKLTHGDVFQVSEIFRNKTDLNFLKPMMQNLDEYRRIKDSALNANGIMDEDFNHMMETTTEQFKQLKINMKELVFPQLHKPIEALNNILVKINSNPVLQKGLFGAVIGTIGVGLLITTIGTGMIVVSKFIGAYGGALNTIRKIGISTKNTMVDLLSFLKFKMTAFYLETGKESLFSGVIQDITHINSSLKYNISNTFKTLFNSVLNLPSSIAKATVELKNWTIASVKAIPTNFINGLNALKSAFLGIPNFIRTAIVSFRAFTLTILTSPLGWIALAIGAVALVIYKYWKPISGFFKGLWAGLMEGLQPVMPMFKKLATAVEPLIKPIRAIIDWIKKIIKPVEDTGGAAEKMGVRFGKAIGNIIVKIANFVATIFSYGIKIPTMLANGILAGVGKVRDAIKTVTQTIRDHLPHSPAKVGPLKDLNKIKLVETIASTIKPTPIMSAMNKTLGVVSSGIKANVGRAPVSGGSTVINYNPTITISGGNASLKDEFTQLLKKHKEEILKLVRQENERKLRLAY